MDKKDFKLLELKGRRYLFLIKEGAEIKKANDNFNALVEAYPDIKFVGLFENFRLKEVSKIEIKQMIKKLQALLVENE